MFSVVRVSSWCLVAAVAAWTIGGEPKQTPYSVAVRVTTAAGTAIADLRASDFQLALDGVPWPIDSATFIERQQVQTPADEARPYQTNQGAESSRDVFVIIDQNAIGSPGGSMLRPAVAAVLGRVSSHDRLSLVVLGRDGLTVGPTTSQQRILSVVERLDLLGTDVCRVDDAAGALISKVGSWSSPFPPDIVLFSGVTTVRPSASGDYCALSDQQRPLLTKAVQSSAANVTIVQLRNRASELPSNTGLVQLAKTLGAPLIRLSDHPESLATIVVDQSRSYYRLTFSIPTDKQFLQPKQIGLTVSRPNTTLRFPTVLSPDQASNSLSAVMASHSVWPDFPLRARTLVSGSTKADRLLIVLFEQDSPEPLAGAVVGVFDGGGNLIRRWTAQPQDLGERPLSAAVRVPPSGTFRVRVAGVSQSGRFGSLDQELEITDRKGDTRPSFSSIVLGVAGDKTLVPRLGFTNEPIANVYMEMYNSPSTVAVSARFDLMSGDSTAIVSVPGICNYSEKSSAFFIEARLPISAINPGDYQVHATVTVGGRQLEPVIAVLHKSGGTILRSRGIVRR